MKEYTEVFQKLASQNNPSETEDQIISHYSGGLKSSVPEKMQLHTAMNLSKMINMVEQVERCSTKFWKHTYSYGASTSKENPHESTPAVTSTINKGPILGNPKDTCGQPLEPFL